MINDFSSDNTSNLVKNKHINIIELCCNLGIGGAVQTGYKYAYNNNYDCAIQIDGDGQHDPKYIWDLIEELNNGYDFVIGSRFIKKEGFQSSIIRRFGIVFFRKVIFLLTKHKITDPTSGFRICNRKVIELYSKWYPLDYPEPETVTYLLKNGYKVKEIPVVMRKREEGKSSINFVKSIYYMIKVTMALFFVVNEVKKQNDR